MISHVYFHREANKDPKNGRRHMISEKGGRYEDTRNRQS
jgi:hypothetical protein